MRYLYYCNSAYQIINAINIHLWRKNKGFEDINDYHAEIIILNAFASAYEFKTIIEKSNLFDRVLFINNVNDKKYFHRISSFLNVAFPNNYLISTYGKEFKNMQNYYDVIVVPKMSNITAAIWQINRHAKLHIIEDGMATYLYDKALLPTSKSHILFYKKFNYGRSFNKDYDFIYLNEPRLYVGLDKLRIKKIPTMKNNIDIIANIFNKYVLNNDNKKIYWFSQDLGEELNKAINAVLLDFKDDVAFCPHPRLNEKNIKDFFNVDKKDIWEFKVVGTKNIDKLCLVSVCSTASFTPKFLYEKEPYVIFINKIYDQYRKNDLIKFNDIINNLKTTYSNPNKIFVPNTVDEFKKALQTYYDEEYK